MSVSSASVVLLTLQRNPSRLKGFSRQKRVVLLSNITCYREILESNFQNFPEKASQNCVNWGRPLEQLIWRSEFTSLIIGSNAHLENSDERVGCLAEAVCSTCHHPSPHFASDLDKERQGREGGLRGEEEVGESKEGGGWDVVAIVVVAIVVVIIVVMVVVYVIVDVYVIVYVVVYVAVVVVMANVVVIFAIIIIIIITRWMREGWTATLHLRGTSRVGPLSTTAKTIHSFLLVELMIMMIMMVIMMIVIRWLDH